MRGCSQPPNGAKSANERASEPTYLCTISTWHRQIANQSGRMDAAAKSGPMMLLLRELTTPARGANQTSLPLHGVRFVIANAHHTCRQHTRGLVQRGKAVHDGLEQRNVAALRQWDAVQAGSGGT